jgi:hypothetical protein
MLLIILILTGLSNGLTPPQKADSVYYAKVTYVRNYMNSDRTTVTEFWNAREKSCQQTGQRKLIRRSDLGLLYSINMQAKTYTVDSIRKSMPKPPSTNEIDFKHIGQDYIPIYEWKDAQKLDKESVCNHPCDHYSCEGDADFDRISLDYFITPVKDEALKGMINSIMISYLGPPNKSEPLSETVEKEKNILILKMIQKVENAIAPAATTTYTVDTFTKVPPTEDLFGLTADFRKIN